MSKKQKAAPKKSTTAQRLYGPLPKRRQPRVTVKTLQREMQYLRQQVAHAQQRTLDLANVGLTGERLLQLTTRVSTAAREMAALAQGLELDALRLRSAREARAQEDHSES